MKILDAKRLIAIFEETVHYLYRAEQRFVLTVELEEDVVHPVDHAGANRTIDAVSFKEV